MRKLLAMIVVLAACGGGDATDVSGSASAPSSVAVASPEPSPTPSIAAHSPSPTEVPTGAPTSERPSLEPSEVESQASACTEAVESAAAIGEMEDTVEDLDGAIVACGSIQELADELVDFPDVLDGIDAETYVANRCLYGSDDVAGSAICAEVS